MLPVYVDEFMNGNKSVSLCKNIPLIKNYTPISQQVCIFISFMVTCSFSIYIKLTKKASLCVPAGLVLGTVEDLA